MEQEVSLLERSGTGVPLQPGSHRAVGLVAVKRNVKVTSPCSVSSFDDPVGGLEERIVAHVEGEFAEPRTILSEPSPALGHRVMVTVNGEDEPGYFSFSE